MKAPVALVTGGGTGIGAATCRALAAAGWSVVAVGRRRGPLDALARATGAHPVRADVSTTDGAERCVAEAVRRFDRLDAVVLNAGVGGPGSLPEVDPAGFERVYRVNVVGPLLVARAALPHLLARRGSIVSIASVAGLQASPASLAYCSSKAALVMLTKCFAVDHGPAGVRANCVCPGWTRTPRADLEMDELAGALGSERAAAYTEVTRHVPLRRPCSADEVAAAVRWLVGPDASYVNGAVITVDGGSSVVDVATTAFSQVDARP